MAVEKILFFFALVAATPLVYSKHVSLWEDSVFAHDSDYNPFAEGVPSHDAVETKHSNICETEDCKRVAEGLLGSMNKSANPCEDFYEFTCGRWAANNPIPLGAWRTGRDQVFQSLVDQRISEILKEEPDSNEILPVEQAKKWYRSCVDTETLERKGLEPIFSIVEKAGGWPLTMNDDDWNDEDHPWQKIEGHYANLTGHNTFYDVRSIGYGNVVILAPELLRARSELRENWMYATFVTNVIDLFVEPTSFALTRTAYMEAQRIINFETELLQLIVNDQMTPVKSFQRLDEFIGMNDNDSRIDWQSGIQGLFNPLNIEILPYTYLTNTGYMTELGALLKRTPLRTIVNYVHWNFITAMLSYTTENMRNKIFETRVGAQIRVRDIEPRWVECLKEVKKEMKYVGPYVFSKRYYPKSTRTAASEMIENIKLSLEANIDNSNWLDESTKYLTKEKIRALKVVTGIPEWYNDGAAVTDYYKGLTIGTEYLDNALSHMRFQRRQALMPYTSFIVAQDTGFRDPTTVNAAYTAQLNIMHTPPAIFQSPLFTPGLPDNVNYGQAGFIIGHEIGHGFDTTGIRYGKNGEYADISEMILRSYYQRARCFVDQFDKYFGVTEGPVNRAVNLPYDDLGHSRGSITVIENIADSTGLQAVFQAYKNQKATKGSNEPKLPGLEEFTDEQLFFIAFGSYQCVLTTPALDEINKNDPHGPKKLRLIGAVSNTNDFAKVFNCPIESPMNPSDKCSIWKKSDPTPEMIQLGRLTSHRREWIED